MLNYFLPDWEDRLDPDFDFEHDKYSNGHIKNPYEYDVYAHQIFEKPPYDGILVSLSVFESKLALKSNGKKAYCIRNSSNIKDYLKIKEDSPLKVMGDCGAFGYVAEKRPPPLYNVENVARLYDGLGFDYGVSVDHLVLDYAFIKNKKNGKREKKSFSQNDKEIRLTFTLENAKKFKKIHKKNSYNFVPIGVAQGYNSKTYKESVESLVCMDYQYIALGGLVQYNSEFIIEVLEKIQPYIRGINVHLFGVLRPKFLKQFEELGVTSFDSASYLRKAWLRSGQNYLGSNGKWYAAIRVPQSSNKRLLKNSGGYSKESIEQMETTALTSLVRYDRGEIEMEEALEAVLNYDKLLLRNSDDGIGLKEKYARTLLDKPWKSCECNICKKRGIQVLIFRGCNRNKRRGFHNTWAFQNMKSSD